MDRPSRGPRRERDELKGVYPIYGSPVRLTLNERGYMTSLVLALLLALQAPTVAPKITGFSIQGTTVNLDYYKGQKNVLVVFYRTQA